MSRRGMAGGAAAGWPSAGAVLVGGALAVGLLVLASLVLGVLQRLQWVTWTPPVVHAAGTYLAAAAGGWAAGRLAGRRGALVGLCTGAFLCVMAAWVLSAGWGGAAAPESGGGWTGVPACGEQPWSWRWQPWGGPSAWRPCKGALASRPCKGAMTRL